MEQGLPASLRIKPKHYGTFLPYQKDKFALTLHENKWKKLYTASEPFAITIITRANTAGTGQQGYCKGAALIEWNRVLNMVSAMFFQQDLLAVNFAAPLYLLILVDSVKIHICFFLIIYPFHSLVEEVNHQQDLTCLFLLEEVATIRYFTILFTDA
ncbi:hypothetical protein ACJX0J_010776 [Zea mays]